MASLRIIASLWMMLCTIAGCLPAVASLCCPCSALHHHTPMCGCNHHANPTSETSLAEQWQSGENCCDDLHQVGGLVFNSSVEEGERQLRATSLIDMEALPVAGYKPMRQVTTSISLARSSHHPLRGCLASTAGLRAPPVTA